MPEGLPVLPCLEGEPLMLDLLPEEFNAVEFRGAGWEEIEEQSPAFPEADHVEAPAGVSGDREFAPPPRQA